MQTCYCQIILSAFLVALGSSLYRIWQRQRINSVYNEYIGKAIFIGGSTTLVSLYLGMALSNAILFIPFSACWVLLSPEKYFNFKRQNIIKTELFLVLLNLVGLLPVILLLWINDCFWPSMLTAAMLSQFCYIFSKLLPIKANYFKRKFALTDFMIGWQLGLCLGISIVIKIY